jgi:glycosyltransferase involved in cell wall biosynthesis
MPEYRDAMPLVSIIVPIYNAEKYLKECILSIMQQTYTNLEIILVNDGSTDNSGHICDTFMCGDERIMVVHRENGGPATARNIGISISKGKYIQFVDSDDRIRSDATEKCVRCAIENNSDLVYFDGEVHAEIGDQDHMEKTYSRKMQYAPAEGRETFINLILAGDYYASPCLYMAKADLLSNNSIGFYDGILYEDNIFTYLVFVSAHKAVHLKYKLYFRRIRENSIMTAVPTIRNAEDLFIAFSEIYNYSKYLSDKTWMRAVFRLLYLLFGELLDVFCRFDDGSKTCCEYIGKVYGFVESNRIFGNTENIFNRKYARVIWYGHGRRFKYILEKLRPFEPDEIWDMNAENGLPPRFESLVGDLNTLLVVCIDDIAVFENIHSTCEKYGFKNVHTWFAYLLHYLQYKSLNHCPLKHTIDAP